MPIFYKLSHLFRRLTEELNWFALLVLILAQGGISWILLWLAGEAELTKLDTFVYYNAVVVSTVGFGDFSPVSHAGKLVVAFFQIPVGLLVFGAFIGKITQFIVTVLRKGMNGNKDFSHLDNHVLLFGWNEGKTEKIIEYILADKKRVQRKIVLCVTANMAHPFVDKSEVAFARLSSFTEPKEMVRVAVANASRIIIDGANDDETLTIALGLGAYADASANISAYFHDESKSKLLKLHCPNVECSTSKQAEVLVRSMQDPGTSQVAEHMFSALAGATLYSMKLSHSQENMSFEKLFNWLKQQHDVTLIGIAQTKNGDGMVLNPALDFTVIPGVYLHYIAKERLLANEVDWQQV